MYYNIYYMHNFTVIIKYLIILMELHIDIPSVKMTKFN